MSKAKTATRLNLFKMIVIFIMGAVPFIILPFFIVAELLDLPLRADVAPMLFDKPPDSYYARYQYPGGGRLSDAKVAYDPSVVAVVKEMGFTLEHFGAWQEEHPGSVVKNIKYMSAEMQRNVASTALFIRKSNCRIDVKTAWREAAALVHYSAKYGVPSILTTAVAKVESTFDPDAVSSKGASGVMQVMWRIHNGLLMSNGIQPTPGNNPLADPEYAIAAGCLLLSRYIRAYGSVHAAIDRYYGKNSASYQRKVNSGISSILTHRSQFFN
ncbi:MAG: transglycosylase SLT domain-containing protein [Synergistaceae bacterium]|nr:transglycosylase SLT domain-containing protein [Synergistaceae bacterium]